jgi:small subunit ribosomal protein S1
MLQRERDELREKLWGELEVGQLRDGIVRKIIDSGAFVDLGGADGFIPIGAMSWGRIKHPSDVLTEGTRVTVRLAKIDREANRISLIYRDEASNPWANIFERFQEKTVARGKVTRIMDFGAFVELMPGVEGLVHISELSRKRVGNVHEVLKEGEWIDVYIVSIDAASKRLSLSMKELAPELPPEPIAEASQEPEPVQKGKGKKNVEPVAAPVKFKPTKGPLKGGAGESSGGEKFGLKW